MREIKKYVRFYIEKRSAWKDQSDQRPRNVVMMFNYLGKRLCTLTGLKVAECDWDSSKQRVKLNVKRGSEVNACLHGLEQKVNDIYFAALAQGIMPDNNHILKEMKKDRKAEKPSLIIEWDKYLKVQKNSLKATSVMALTHSYEHFKKFTKGKRVEFDDVNSELVSKYAEYLQSLGHVDNTVNKHIKRMRAFMTYAKKVGLHNNERYRDFNVSQKTGRIIFLDWDEVNILMNYKPKNSEEHKVLSGFLFLCTTGMRYSDYHALKRTDVVKVSFDGLPNIFYGANIRQLKTDAITVVPLLPEAMDIINRHRDEKCDYALPRVSNQVMNRVIKDICKAAEINSKVPVDVFKNGKRETKYYEKWELISSHIGRKTFSSLSAARGLPINLVASIVGNSTKTCMKYYAGVADKDRFVRVVEEMKFRKDESTIIKAGQPVQ